jgi:hypothetical protein
MWRHREHVPQVRRAIFVRRSADGDEHDIRRRDRGGDVGREAKPPLALITFDVVVEARLVDRQDILLQPIDLRLVEVCADDGVSGLGETGADDEPDIARPDDGDVHGVRVWWKGAMTRQRITGARGRRWT